VARELRDAGWPDARALVGGWSAWLDAGLPVEPKEDEVPSAWAVDGTSFPITNHRQPRTYNQL